MPGRSSGPPRRWRGGGGRAEGAGAFGLDVVEAVTSDGRHGVGLVRDGAAVYEGRSPSGGPGAARVPRTRGATPDVLQAGRAARRGPRRASYDVLVVTFSS